MAADYFQFSYTHFCTLFIKILMNSGINGKAYKP